MFSCSYKCQSNSIFGQEGQPHILLFFFLGIIPIVPKIKQVHNQRNKALNAQWCVNTKSNGFIFNDHI